MAPGGPDMRRVAPGAGAMSAPDLAATVACGVTAAATEILERFTQPSQVNEADCPPVNLAANAAIWECLQRCKAATPRTAPTGQATSDSVSAFDWLGHWAPASEEGQWASWPEMTPCKVDRGRQTSKEQESQQVTSQKQRSQSQPRDETDPKKGRTEGETKSVSTGQLRVSRNPFPSQTLGLNLPDLEPLEPVAADSPVQSPLIKTPRGTSLPPRIGSVVKQGDSPIPHQKCSRVTQRGRNLGISHIGG